MTNFRLRIVMLLCLPLLFTACLGPRSPQEVTAAFWSAVIEEDTDTVLSTSTLVNSENYNSFGAKWQGYQVSYGKVVIDSDNASVETVLSHPDNKDTDKRQFVTYLVKKHDEWKVDYTATEREIQGGALASLFGQISKLGERLSEELKRSATDLRVEMDRMAKELRQFSDSFGRQAKEDIKHFADKFRERINALSSSIEEALKKHQDSLSDDDKDTMQQVLADLEDNNNSLSGNPDIQSIATGGQSVGQAQYRLENINSHAVDDYRETWRDMAERVEKDMQEMMNSLSAATGKN